LSGSGESGFVSPFEMFTGESAFFDPLKVFDVLDGLVAVVGGRGQLFVEAGYCFVVVFARALYRFVT
jgi:hypothetical protein